MTSPTLAARIATLTTCIERLEGLLTTSVVTCAREQEARNAMSFEIIALHTLLDQLNGDYCRQTNPIRGWTPSVR